MYLAKKPALPVSDNHTGVGAEKRRVDDADSLTNVISLTESAKAMLMLTRNLWVYQGLTNGSMRQVREILRNDVARLGIDMPGN